MNNGLIDTAAQIETPEDRRIYGVVIARVVNNIDQTSMGRVQVSLPWLPGFEPWARVVVLMTGQKHGTYFIPQVDEEVLVAFNHGDVREPFVIGCLRNGQSMPPAQIPTDACTKRIIRTPAGHEIVFDDEAQSIKITSSNNHKIMISPEEIEVSTVGSTSSLILEKDGRVTIESKKSIELKAPSINIQGTKVDISGSASARIDGGGSCSIQAGTVRIN